MFIKLISLIIILCFSLCSCNINATYENRKEDKEDAEIIIQSFYGYLKKGQLSHTYHLFTKRFFAVTDTAKFVSIYEDISNQCGDIINYSISEWKTTTTTGVEPKSEYVFVYKVTRAKCKTKETIALKKEKDNIKIALYNVKSY